MNYTPQQKIKIERLRRVIDAGSFGSVELLKFIDELQSFVTELQASTEKQFKEIKSEIKTDLQTDQEFLDSIKSEDGKPGENYILTEADKKQIAASIPPVFVDKVIVEKTEVVHEQPITIDKTVTKTEIKEVAKYETSVEIRNKLESLTEDDRLDISAIKGLDERFKKIEKKNSGQNSNPAGGGRGHIKNYDLSSSLDGLTTTFNLPANWSIINVVCSSFPGALRPLIDYTWTPTSITFTNQIQASSTLAAGQTVIVIYEES